MWRGLMRVAMACMFAFAGAMHFLAPETFLMIVPPVLPWPLALVYISGAFEMLGAMGLLLPTCQRVAAYGLAVLLVAILPANIYAALNNIQAGGLMNSPVVQWVRVPFQGVLIWWVLWCTKPIPVGYAKTQD